jgi:hypothetical protein
MSDAYFAQRQMAGERILWTGRPSGGLLFTALDWFLVPFSAVWLGFVLVPISGMVSGPSQDVGGMIFMLMFVIIGLFALFGRFLVDAWIRRGTQYALTDRRILISRPAPFRAFIAVGLAQLPDVQLNERGDGSGTIRFGPGRSLWSRQGLNIWMPSVDSVPQFLAIGSARQVFDRVQQAAAKAGSVRA